MQSEDGRVGLKNGFEVFFRRFGAGERTPLLILRGGPGPGHVYLEPLARLGEERQVVFYDQLGCGQSDHPDTPELWTIDYFVGEIDEAMLDTRRHENPHFRLPAIQGQAL